MYSVQEAMQSPVFLAGFLQRCATATGNQVEPPLPPHFPFRCCEHVQISSSFFPLDLTSSQKTVHRRRQQYHVGMMV